LRLIRQFVRNNLHLASIDRGEPLIGPWSVQLDPTLRCEHGCIGCWTHSPLYAEEKRPFSSIDLDFAAIRTLLRDLADLGTCVVYVSGGGEPFMHPEIWRILECICESGMEFCLHTNLLHLDTNAIERLLRLAPRQVTVSLWGAHPETYRRTHPGQDPESHHRILQNVEFLVESRRTAVKLHSVLTRFCAAELPDLIRMAHRLDVSAVDIALIDPIPSVTDGILPDRREADTLLRTLSECEDRRVSVDPQTIRRLQGISNGHSVCCLSSVECDDHLFPCYAGWFSVRITAEGNVLYCLKGHRCPMGNIHESEFRDIWTSESFQQMRWAGAHGTNSERKSAFALMGNDPRVRPGCLAGCDDYRLNCILRSRLGRYRLLKKHLVSPSLIDRYRRV